MTTPVSKIRNEVADREAIRECLYRYCRGVDRLDADMVRSAYWPDVVDTHLEFTEKTRRRVAHFGAFGGHRLVPYLPGFGRLVTGHVGPHDRAGRTLSR